MCAHLRVDFEFGQHQYILSVSIILLINTHVYYSAKCYPICPLICFVLPQFAYCYLNKRELLVAVNPTKYLLVE